MDGCSKSCKIEDNFDCVVLPIGSTSKCTSNVKDNCGNGRLEESLGEKCDDNNQYDYDGCSSTCQVEDGYSCTSLGRGSRCILVTPKRSCGNGYYQPTLGEQCDDNNNRPFDGCSSNCMIEYGWECTHIGIFPLSKCNLKCGNGLLEKNFLEECDDGNYYDDDGCSGLCQV